MAEAAFIFLYESKEDQQTKLILDLIKDTIEISSILVSKDDEDTRKWLSNNSKGVRVTKLPAFLLSQRGPKAESTTVAREGSILVAKELIEHIRKVTE